MDTKRTRDSRLRFSSPEDGSGRQLRSRLVVLLEHVRVDRQRDHHRAMTEAFADHLGGDSGPQGCRGVGVTEPVGPDPGEADLVACCREP